MVQDCTKHGKKCQKHAHDNGEPAAKRHCAIQKPPKFTKPFNGTNETADKSKGVKRNAPQDALSAQVYPRYLRIY
uniref:ShKT domain-containing protein n=1 Tax=Caenorhabditis tropicalis TaxID=1561998 RepID=A0A1I7TAY3_9PELO